MVTPLDRRIGLYFHIPFCTKKCPYCHFFVTPYRQDIIDGFVATLQRELAWRAPLLEGKELLSLYFGGGTPSLLEAEQLNTILQALPEKPKEITIEVNPETVTAEKIGAYREIGINRISIGIQSLVDSELLLLGRTHNASKAVEAIHIAHSAGIKNISVDLMYELPKQTPHSWSVTLQQTIALPITHLSLYNLTFEPHTPFHTQRRELLPLIAQDEEKVQMLKEAIFCFASAGLERYEISAFAKPGFTSLHNSGYWLGRNFLGFGPSAFSFWEGSRFRNICSIQKWAGALKEKNSPLDFEETLSSEDAYNELLAIQLRMLSGCDLSSRGELPERTRSTLSQLVRDDFLIQEGSRIWLSERGLLFYDDVASAII